MKYYLSFFLFLITLETFSQVVISGKVKDENGKPLTGANIFIKGTYDGAVTDTNGVFRFKGFSTDTSILYVSYIGYTPFEASLIDILKSQPLEIILLENANVLQTVVITAGSFEAGEKSRAVLLTPVEIATTASSDGDVYGALKTFPGVQKQGETGKIIVRGGEAGESKTYIDGILVSSPYNSSLPDLPSRGRFSPFMFNGVMFSTGGYSAEYGQALSSVLELKTPGLFDEDITSVSLMNVGVGLGHTERYTNSAYSAELSYNNMYPYFLMAKSDLDWIEVPENIGANFYHRQQIGKTGMLKTDATYSSSSSKLDYNNFENGFDEVGMNTGNLFLKTGYNNELGEKWLLKTGIAYNYNKDNKDFGSNELNDRLETVHARIGLVNYKNKNITLKFGTDLFTLNSKFNYYIDTNSIDIKLDVNEILSAGYFESDIKILKNTALRVGLRSEYSAKNNNANIVPRISVAQKISDNSQLSVAFGEYYQQADREYLKFNNNLENEKATHFIANYQIQKYGRVFRSEVYYKKYQNLVTYELASIGEYKNLANNGSGYARGIDIFWKDDRTFKFTNYWISYSYVDSKRKFKDYSTSVLPEFVSAHNFSVVVKCWLDRINTQACLTYNFNSGRPYNNPNDSIFMNERTSSFHDLSGSLSYVTSLFGSMTVVHLSVSNVLGTKKIYTYQYNLQPDDEGIYQGYPISSMVQRTIILGIFISIK